MRKWRERYAPLKYSSPSVKILLLALGFFSVGVLILLTQNALNSFRDLIGGGQYFYFTSDAFKTFAVAFALLIGAVVERYMRSDVRQIQHMVTAVLCQPKYGNPLGLRDGNIEPSVGVRRESHGYRIRIGCPSVDFEKVANLDSTISGCLVGEFYGYAVVSKDESVSGTHVDYFIDNEVSNAEKQNVYGSIEELRRRYE